MLTKAAELAAEELETLETPTVRVMAPVLALALEAAAVAFEGAALVFLEARHPALALEDGAEVEFALDFAAAELDFALDALTEAALVLFD